jgi:hypothetical protein
MRYDAQDAEIISAFGCRQTEFSIDDLRWKLTEIGVNALGPTMGSLHRVIDVRLGKA